MRSSVIRAIGKSEDFILNFNLLTLGDGGLSVDRLCRIY